MVLLGSYLGRLKSFMFLNIISQNYFLSISDSILFEIYSALWNYSFERFNSVVFPGTSTY